MKRDNREGPAVLDGFPEPQKMEAEKVAELSSSKKSAIIDTRDRTAYMNGHLKGSLLSPLNKVFNTVVGSYVREEEEIYLIIDENDLDEAIRDLIRIGLDNIKGFVTPRELEQYLAKNNSAETIEIITFDDTEKLLTNGQYQPLDVRKATEFNEGHVEKAKNIAHTRLLERKEELDKGKTWLVYCRTGSRASVASALLKRDGFNLKYVDDNIEPWLAEQKMAKVQE
jgi:hydroxyacylglutathione hydrolase